MSNVSVLNVTESTARQWALEAASGRRRLLFSGHAEEQMKKRRIGRRQVLECLKAGAISEPVHRDIRGDWRCDLSAFVAGARLTVGVVFKLAADGAIVIVLTAFEGK